MKKKKISLARKRAITGLVFISPWLIGVSLFYVKSLVTTVQFAFSKIEIQAAGGYLLSFTGLDNFRNALFKDATFNQIFVNSLADILIDVPLIITFSLLMALLINQKFRGRTLMRAMLFLPVLFGAGAINDAMNFARQAVQGGIGVESAEFEAINSQVSVMYFLNIFMELGFPENLLNYIVGAVQRIYEVIQASGVQIIIFLAALQSVPGSLYEVAKIEGATGYETFWKVTLPMVSPHILTNIVYTIVDSFTNSEVVDKAYDMAFSSYNYGLSSAMSLLSTATVCLILGVLVYTISKRTFYYN